MCLLIYNVAIILVHPYKSDITTVASEVHVLKSYRRSIILLFVNHLEFTLWFSACYLVMPRTWLIPDEPGRSQCPGLLSRRGCVKLLFDDKPR